MQSMQPQSKSSKRPLPSDLHESDAEDTARFRRLRTSPNGPPGAARLTLRHEDYTIVWMCALPLERAAAEAVLDQEHQSLSTHGSDNNIYTLGRIAKHNVVIACLPDGAYGVTSATQVLGDTLHTFPKLRHGLMVGIGGGVPGPNNDIRLGDVVVGNKVTPYGPAKVTERGRLMTEASIRPHDAWLQVVSRVRSAHERAVAGRPTRMAAIQGSCFEGMPDYHHPRQEDRLFSADYNHAASPYADCRHCEASKTVDRDQRLSKEPKIHYGTIASGHDLIKLGAERQRLAAELDVLCFEMEAAGLMNRMRCLPIRGVSDYADSHKNQVWQRYAAANAAALAKEILEWLPPEPKESSTHEMPVGVGCQKNTVPEYQASSSAPSRAELLESLKFDRFDVRRKAMRSSYRKTCQWLLEQAEYREWLDVPCNSRHGGFLWIKGNPGTGKSTLMKFLFENEVTNATKRQRKNGIKEVVASFFFNARGNDMEQSVEGMYRALILQILRAFTDLQDVLDDIDTKTAVSEGICLSELEGLFQAIASRLGSRRVTCFIDALDEGGRKQVVEMVKRFQDVLEDHTSQDSQLRLCFSSRHYPYIEPRVGLELILEDLPGHSADLREYVLGTLDISNLTYKQEVAATLLEKAKGIFLWAALVVDYLNEDIRSGLPVKERLSFRLAQVPEGLHELFQHILSRHSSDMNTFRLMVAWLLFSKQQLSPRQVDHALWSGEHGDELRKFTPPNFDEPDTEERIRKRVISASKGLAEILAVDYPTVQFIHESVRDFLLKDHGLERLWPNFNDGDATHYCHDLLKSCCDQYLNHPLIVKELPCKVPKVTELTSSHRESRRDHLETLMASYPMLEYACQNMVWHADAAAPSCAQDSFLSGIDVPFWTRALNYFELYASRFYDEDADLLCILANRGYAQLIRDWNGQFSVHYTAPIVAAIAGKQERAFTVLMGKVLPGYQATEYRNLSPLLDRIPRCKGRTLLTLAAQEGCAELLERLLREGARLDDRDDSGRSGIYRALANDRLSALKVFVQHGEFDWKGDDSLQICLHSGADRCAAWLVAHGAYIDRRFRHRRGGSLMLLPALEIASGMHMLLTVRALLAKGVDANGAAGSKHQSPLSSESGMAIRDLTERAPQDEARSRHLEDCRTTPLMWACRRRYRGTDILLKVIDALVAAGADQHINAYNESGQTALMMATDIGHFMGMEHLQQAGADPHAVDREGHSLYWYVPEGVFYERRCYSLFGKYGVRPTEVDGERVWKLFRSYSEEERL